MQVEEALVAVEQRLDRGCLSKTEAIVFRQCWEGRSYLEIAQTSGYDAGYIKDTGYRLWQRLSEAYGEKVTKQNFKGVLRRVVERDRSVSIVSPQVHPTTTLRQDWGDAIDVSIFYGRTQELATLQQWMKAFNSIGNLLQQQCERFSANASTTPGGNESHAECGRP